MKHVMKSPIIIIHHIVLTFVIVMITGCIRNDLYSNAKNDSGSLITTTLFQIKPSGFVNYSAPWIASGTAYLSCDYATLTVQDSSSSPLQYVKDITSYLDCRGTCVFYSDANCSNVITQVTIPAGNSASPPFFIQPGGPILILDMSVTPVIFVGYPVHTVAVSASYSAIDYHYVWAQNDLSTAGTAIDETAIAAGDTWIFQTYDGYRGKLLVNSRSSTSITGDTLNFDMIVWDSSGTLINSAGGVDIVACSSGNCYFDFHSSPPVVTGSPNADFKWSVSGGVFSLIPNQSSVVRVIP